MRKPGRRFLKLSSLLGLALVGAWSSRRRTSASTREADPEPLGHPATGPLAGPLVPQRSVSSPPSGRGRLRRAFAIPVACCLVAVLVGTAVLHERHGGQAVAQADRSAPLNVGIAYGDVLTFMDGPQLARALDDARSLGAHWVRADLSWADVQPSSPDSYEWAAYDRIVAGASARGLHVLPILISTPAWARPDGCDSQSCKPASLGAFARFVRAAASRYAGRGVHTWEIWNEPNTVGAWKPAPSAGDYSALLRASVRSIRAVDRTAFVVSGGLAAVATGRGNVSQLDFLRRFSALGGNRLVNAIGYHPYTYPFLASLVASFSTSWDRIDRAPVSLRRVLVHYGTPRLPFWLTEYGAPTGGPGSASSGVQTPSTTHVTEARQSEIVVDAVRTALADGGIGALFIYSDQDLEPTSATSLSHYGLRRADGTFKPAFSALRAELRAVRSEIG